MENPSEQQDANPEGFIDAKNIDDPDDTFDEEASIDRLCLANLKLIPTRLEEEPNLRHFLISSHVLGLYAPSFLINVKILRRIPGLLMYFES